MTLLCLRIRFGALLLCAVFACFGAAQNSLDSAQVQQGWILLFDGRSLFGWSAAAGAGWTASAGTLESNGNASTQLRTVSPFSDFDLRFEYSLSSPNDQAFLVLRAGKEGSQENGYRVPLGDGEAEWPRGSVVNRFKAARAPSAATQFSAAQWHSLSATFDDDRISVTIDNTKVVEGKDQSARAGLIFLESLRGAHVAVRNMMLRPLYLSPLFDGTDLAGWKAVTLPPPSGKPPGMLSKLPHLFEAKPKPRDPKWSVVDGAIRGGGGTGQLETTKSYDSVQIQLAGEAFSNQKKRPAKASIFLRSNPGKLFSGYELPIAGAEAGSIRGLAEPRRSVAAEKLLLETVILSGRHFEIWVNGYPVTDFIDTRPEGDSIAKAAKITPGAIALPEFSADEQVAYRSVSIGSLANSWGGTVAKAAPSSAPSVAETRTPLAAEPKTSSAPTAPAPPPLPAAAPLSSPDQINRQKSAMLMSQALRSTNPEEQMRLYDQVVQLDPTNSAAAQGYKDAQQQVEAKQAKEQKWEGGQVQRLEQERQSGIERDRALERAQDAFVRGDLGAAQRSLSVAQRLAPDNPAVLFLALRLSNAQRIRSELWMIAGGGGLFALTGAAVFFLRRRGDKQACLQVLSGYGAGKKFDLRKEKILIGSIDKDGAYRNDIVLTDARRMVSRFHCEIHRQEHKYFLIDCKSANGTWLDHKPVAPGRPVRLKRGSRIELGGQVALRFELEPVKRS